MEQTILNFHKQFSYNPEIINSEKLGQYKHYILAGMGGSHLSAGILKAYKPGIELYVHRDYGLPMYEDVFLKDSLLIANSHSGNTEEVLDFLQEGYSRGYNMACISRGGKIMKFAKDNKLPYIQTPGDGIQPRSALGYSIMAISKMLRQDLKDMHSLVDILKPEDLKKVGKDLAESLKGKVPIIYTSLKNLPVAYNWKIKFNETSKIPAFYNVFPELNHNEMNSFDLADTVGSLCGNFHFIFIKDNQDHIQVQKRMDITENLLEERGLPVTSLRLEGDSYLERIFSSLLLADWTTLYIAKNNDINPESVEMVEDLKSRL